MKACIIAKCKAWLLALVDKALKTPESLVIGRNGKPMVELKVYRTENAKNRLGAFAGQIQVSDDFDQWDEEEAKAFGIVDE